MAITLKNNDLVFLILLKLDLFTIKRDVKTGYLYPVKKGNDFTRNKKQR